MGWKDLIEEYVKIEKDEFTKHYIGYPKIIDIIRDENKRKGKKVDLIVDYGCGNGFFANKLSKYAQEIVGIDIYAKSIDYAKKEYEKPNIIFRKMSKSVLKELSNKADIVISSFVILTIKEKKTLMKYFRNAYSFLKKDGYFIVLTVHPCFYKREFSSFKKIIDESFNYFKSGSIVPTVLYGEGDEMFFYDYHYNIEHTTKFFYDSGFLIERIFEPEIKEKSRKIEWKDEIKYPPLIIFKAKK
jgi:SAM-dependent methyltransferase